MLRNKLLIFWLLVHSMFMSQGQDFKSKLEKKPSIEAFSYPLFFGHEKHSNFKVSYPLLNNLYFDFKNDFDTYALEDRFRTSIGLKQYISDKIYFSAGLEMEFARDKLTNMWNTRPRSSINSVLGYDVKRNIFIEAKGNIQLNETNWGPYGEHLIPMKEVYSLGGKWKF